MLTVTATNPCYGCGTGETFDLCPACERDLSEWHDLLDDLTLDESTCKAAAEIEYLKAESLGRRY